jgi:hypothetical protein
MSGWPKPVRWAATVVLAVTVDNITGGRTGVYGNGTWGVIPDATYYTSGVWMVPPTFGIAAGSADDLAKSLGDDVVNSLDNLLNCTFAKSSLRTLKKCETRSSKCSRGNTETQPD